MRNLHFLVENELEAPALAWNILAYYWGMSAFGIGPSYQAYMQSDLPKQDRAWNDPMNVEINRIAGYDRPLTIKERFDRAANFYMYCYEQGRSTSINPPFDMPPTIDDMVLSRLRMEAKAAPANKLIQASSDSLLGDDQKVKDLWDQGGKKQRLQRAQAYNARVIDTVQYIAAELDSFRNISRDQLTQTGFLAEGHTGQQFNVTADMMDEVMPEDVQDLKFGECYLQRTPTETHLVTSGIFGAYYTMGHNLELAMYDDESKAKLGSIHFAILRTWRQLYDINHRKELK